MLHLATRLSAVLATLAVALLGGTIRALVAGTESLTFHS